ncbi:unnamed protein product [Psylliodes chrysocephalus]|uniref:Uncharacterized protein n=1 Tax=Psylliodes chrysocephalus TaxID=3402493 RepID=A0A9P0D6E9_9CUCU|nr:unnamed protein product [Psylliodes chrysocephala]
MEELQEKEPVKDSEESEKETMEITKKVLTEVKKEADKATEKNAEKEPKARILPLSKNFGNLFKPFTDLEKNIEKISDAGFEDIKVKTSKRSVSIKEEFEKVTAIIVKTNKSLKKPKILEKQKT